MINLNTTKIVGSALALLVLAGLGLRCWILGVEVDRLEADLVVIRTERDLARQDQEALHLVAEGLRKQARGLEQAYATALEESKAAHEIFESAREVNPGASQVVDNATSDRVLTRLDVLLR